MPTEVRCDSPRGDSPRSPSPRSVPSGAGHVARHALLAVAAIAVAPSARADDDRLVLTVSGFLASSRTTVSADAPDVLGQPIHLEDTFDLTRRKVRGRVDGLLRLSERQRLIFSYARLQRSESARLDESFTYDGEVFDIDTVVRGRFSFRLATLAYEYALVETERVTLGASIGAYWADASVRLTADGYTADAGTRADGGSPALGLRLQWAPAADWRLAARAQAFKANAGKVDGHFARAGVFVERRFGEHLGLQLGYDWFRLRAKYAQPDWAGRLDLTIDGPTAGVSFVF